MTHKSVLNRSSMQANSECNFYFNYLFFHILILMIISMLCEIYGHLFTLACLS